MTVTIGIDAKGLTYRTTGAMPHSMRGRIAELYMAQVEVQTVTGLDGDRSGGQVHMKRGGNADGPARNRAARRVRHRIHGRDVRIMRPAKSEESHPEELDLYNIHNLTREEREQLAFVAPVKGVVQIIFRLIDNQQAVSLGEEYQE